MKRFYCTECKKVRRVRKLPRNVVDVPGAPRSGRCTRHDAPPRVKR